MQSESEQDAFERVRAGQARYYGDLFDEHGAGVDAVASGKQVYKDLRYDRVCDLIPAGTRSLHDVGFGLGHLNDHLRGRDDLADVVYSGSEVTPQFVEHCRKEYPDSEFHLRDLTAAVPDERYDCVVLTGTFYHRQDATEEEFLGFVETLLRNSFEMARLGMVFNLISPFVDYRVGDLFYAPLHRVMALVDDLSRWFVVDHATPLFEYTVGVYREELVAGQYPHEAFDKYFPSRRED